MEDYLIELLETFNYPVYRQGSLTQEEAYPETFFTFWNNESLDNGFFDNAESKTEWNYTVNLYSMHPELLYQKIVEVKTILRKAGFIPNGPGHDIRSDEPTHIGRGFEVVFVERKRGRKNESI